MPRASALAALLFLALTGVSAAACGPGKTPTYSDIDRISYATTVCFGECPTYQVLFDDYKCEYVGQSYVEMPGTYEADCSKAILERAVAALRRFDFYDLNYDSNVIFTDVPHYLFFVTRCGVTTKLDWPAAAFSQSYDRKDIRALMDALDAITKSLKWSKTSDSTKPGWIQRLRRLSLMALR